MTLLSSTLEGGLVTPSKAEQGRAPDRDSQVDIFIESLYYCGQYGKCLVWLESAFHVAYSQYRAAAAVVPTRRFKSNSFLLSRKIFHTITGLVVR